MATYGHRARWALAHDKAVDKDELERRMKVAAASEKKKGARGTLGRLAGAGLAVGATLLTVATGGLATPVTAPVLAGIAAAGSAVGSKVGEMSVGGPTSLGYKGRFYQEEKQAARESISRTEEARDRARWINAASDAFTVFTLGGGGEAFKAGAKGAAELGFKEQMKAGVGAAMKKTVTAGDLMKNTLSQFGLDKLGKTATKESIKPSAGNVLSEHLGKNLMSSLNLPMNKSTVPESDLSYQWIFNR